MILSIQAFGVFIVRQLLNYNDAMYCTLCQLVGSRAIHAYLSFKVKLVSEKL